MMEADAPGPQQSRFPWPPPPGTSPIGALARTWQESIVEPGRFFREMPVPGPVGPAILYYFIIGVAAAGVDLFWRSLFTATGIFRQPAASAFRVGGADSPWSLLLGFLLSPINLLIVLLISFTVIHVTLLILGGARRGAGTTLRVLCFAYGPQLFVVVPFLGHLAAGIWVIVLAVKGLKEAHQTDGWRAVLAVLLPVVVLTGIALAAGFLLFLGSLG